MDGAIYSAFADELVKIAGLKSTLFGLGSKVVPTLKKTKGLMDESAALAKQYGDTALARAKETGRSMKFTPAGEGIGHSLKSPKLRAADLGKRYQEALSGASGPGKWLHSKLAPTSAKSPFMLRSGAEDAAQYAMQEGFGRGRLLRAGS